MQCPSCGTEVTEVLARHDYSIELTNGSWHKSDGEVSYVCGVCCSELDIDDIKDILKTVDEL